MARNQKTDSILSIDELRDRFLSLMAEDYSLVYGVKDIFEARDFPGTELIYLYFIGVDNKIKDRLIYTHKGYICDHVVSGLNFNEIYRDLEFMEVNYILGYL